MTYEIVGVVRDAKYQDLRDGVIEDDVHPVDAAAKAISRRATTIWCASAAGDPMRLAPGSIAWSATSIRRCACGRRCTYATVIDRSIATERIMATLGGLFGVLALVVAGLGMFGVLAFQVARRTNELGVRMALGASRGSMMRLVLRDVVLMLAGRRRASARARALDGDRCRPRDAVRPDADRSRRVRVAASVLAAPRFSPAGCRRAARRAWIR